MRQLAMCLTVLLITYRAIAIDAVVSHAIFYQQAPGKNHLSPTLELYWQVNPNTLRYTTTEQKKIQAKIRTDITLSDDRGALKHDQYILQTVPVSGLDEILLHNIIELKRYETVPGKITIRLRLTDMADTGNRFNYSDSITISPAPDTWFYSSLQLLDTTYQSAAQTSFTKNGMTQVPICTDFLDDNKHMFYYYAELYGNGALRESDYPVVQRVAISKNPAEGLYGNMVHTDTITMQQPVMHISGKFDISTLPSGNYYLRVWLENKLGDAIAAQNLFIQRMNKHPRTDTSKMPVAISDTGIENVTVLDLKKTFVAKYNLAQVRAILKMLLPFSDHQGARAIEGFLKKPDEMYMRYYIYNYFAAINKQDPGKAWKEFSAKITEVNKLFNGNSQPGYETERGFIYLRYGAPTEIIPVENEQGSLPYEIWQYNVLRQMDKKDVPNAIFLFYRPNQMLGDYKLLHSTVTGETQNAKWRSELYTGGGNSDSRAEQYLGNR